MAIPDIITSASCIPYSELLSQIVESIIEVVVAANDVLVKKQSFAELADYLKRIHPLLKELSKKDFSHFESLNKVIHILSQEVKSAKQLTSDCSKRNKVYLLINCRKILIRLENITKSIGRALDLLPLTSLDLSSAISEEIINLSENMQRAKFKVAVEEERIYEKIDSGIQEGGVDRSYANNLLLLIAEALGISTESSELKREFDEFKVEIDNARLRKDQAEEIQMEQLIALLEQADAVSSPKEKEIKYFTKRKSLGSQPLEPLTSFYCPITKEVMVDPVETSSAQTFERSAIERWIAEGKNTCPLTMLNLDTSILRPNKTLRQSIEEWKDRNSMITIASMKSKIMSGDEEEIIDCLEKLKDLCDQRDLHREWMIMENYMDILIQLLSEKNREIKNRSLVILLILAKESGDSKERIAKVPNAIEYIVPLLGRRPDDRRLAVELLLELSKCDLLQDCIGKVQGCILLLVTMSSSDDSQAARDAHDLLENLSVSDNNVIQMAKANYFKHFLQRLSTGPEDVKRRMAAALAELELTDHNKSSLLEGGVLGPLLDLVSHGDVQMRQMAVKSLMNLSTVPSNGLQMIKDGAVRPLVDLLLRSSASFSNLREQVAATIMHLATSTAFQDPSEMPVTLLDAEQDIVMMFSLINLSGPNVQKNILQTFYEMCQSSSAADIKNKLIQGPALPMLVQLCEHCNLTVRANAVKLLCCLLDDCDELTIMEHIVQKNIEALLAIIQTSKDEEEISSALGIISNLPETLHFTEWLLDAGALRVISSFLENGRQIYPIRARITENAAGALCRFAAPTNLEWQKKAAEIGTIPMLVQLLGCGTLLMKKHAATSLARFSQSSPLLTRQVSRRKGLFCFVAPPESICPVHGGICSVESSFCLIEADAVPYLVRILNESDLGASEASLDALLTLIEAERLQSGSKVLADENAIPQMIRFLSSPFPSLQEKSLSALERIFRLPEFKLKYGSSAQMPLIDLTQRGSSSMKSLSARILAHLHLLHDQSSFF
ncbi:hypothetical protein ACFE04_017127 [Oxalis oulophora]